FGDQPVPNQTGSVADELLDRAEQRFVDDTEPIALVPLDEQRSYLGTTTQALRALVGIFKREDTPELVRRAFQEIASDRSFDFTAEDDTFKDMDARTGLEIDYLVTGHTHLERALRRKTGSGFYFNSGTWARLIKVYPAILDSAAAFKQFFD